MYDSHELLLGRRLCGYDTYDYSALPKHYSLSNILRDSRAEGKQAIEAPQRECQIYKHAVVYVNSVSDSLGQRVEIGAANSPRQMYNCACQLRYSSRLPLSGGER